MFSCKIASRTFAAVNLCYFFLYRQSGKGLSKRNALRNSQSRWTGGVVPFSLSSGFSRCFSRNIFISSIFLYIKYFCIFVYQIFRVLLLSIYPPADSRAWMCKIVFHKYETIIIILYSTLWWVHIIHKLPDQFCNRFPISSNHPIRCQRVE